MMPNLAPKNQQQKKLKDNWFNLVPNPDDPNAWFWKLVEQRNKEYIEWETKGKWEQ